MTVGTAKDAPTIRIVRDEQFEGTSKGLAILLAESVGAAAPHEDEGVHQDQAANQQETPTHNELVARVIQKCEGQIVRTMDGLTMAEFADLSAAVHAAVAMQLLVKESAGASAGSNGWPSGQPGLRIGIHGISSGSQSLVQRMDAFGEAVHAAASIAQHAAAGQILVSRAISEALSNENDVHMQWFQKACIDSRSESEDIFEVHWAKTVTGLPSRYEALFQVGAGGMGIVYKARDRETGEIVALKVLRSEVAADPSMQETLKREVRLARKVTHKNVCRIHEFNRSEGTSSISMEFVEGASLQSMLARNGALSWSQALKIAVQLCSGLGEAHAQGIVHRDLKPANIMIDRGGVAKIMDFGIARPLHGAAQLTGTLVGTPAYMAPEQVELKAVDARTDIYAMGLLLYEIVTGSQAFEGETPIAVAVKQLRDYPKRPREIVPSLPAQAEAVILTCLEKDPAKRFQTMDELAAALNREPQAKPAAALWRTFVSDMRGYRRDLRASVQPGIQALGSLMKKLSERARNWKFPRTHQWKFVADKRTQKALVVGLAGTVCLVALVAFGMRGARAHHAVGAASTATAADAADQGSQIVPPAAVADTGHGLAAQGSAGSATHGWSREVDLHAEPDAQPASSEPAKAAPSVKVAPAKRISASSSTAAKNSASQSAAQMKPEAPAASSLDTETSAAISDEQNGADEAADSAASHLTATAPATPAPAAVEEKPADGEAAQLHYFDVGSFKEAAWADSVVEKLTQLGFHAVSVHKSVLWMQSYQVRVGPYTDPKDVQAAWLALIAQGFKPHAVK